MVIFSNGILAGSVLFSNPSMRRDVQNYLRQWLSATDRKPLVIRGARQVGKTHAVRALAAEEGYDLVELNLDLERDLHALFALEPKRFFVELAAIKGINFQRIKPLLFIDEIQACPQALAALRYFKEHTPEVPVISAGSLLDFALRDFTSSMPVGRIEFLYMYPLTFVEFIRTLAGDELADYWSGINSLEPISVPLHTKFLQLLRSYYFVGGMPEVVAKYAQDHSYLDVQKIQSAIIQTYESDFSKYGEKSQFELLRRVFRQIPANIGKKIKYVNLSRDHRSAQVKEVFELLHLAGVCFPVYRTSGNGIPLGADTDFNHYKAVFLDIGLAHHILGLRLYDPNALPSMEGLVTVMEGAMAEQFVGQEFLGNHHYYERKELYYWHRESKNSNAEIDYLDSYGERVIPYDVKAGAGTTLRSLQAFIAEKHCTRAYRLWVNNIQRDALVVRSREEQADLYSFPLYLAGRLNGRGMLKID